MRLELVLGHVQPLGLRDGGLGRDSVVVVVEQLLFATTSALMALSLMIFEAVRFQASFASCFTL